MKTTLLKNIKRVSAALLAMSPALAIAQQPAINNLRAYDKTGINVFEAPKDTTTEFEGLKVRFGAGFTQSFQNLKHENKSTVAANKLYALSPGFNTANANLFMDVQLADGIRLNLTSYLSSRHHNETWVKGGYIQFDKLPFKGQIWEDIMKYTTIKVGHSEINYGDQHFRRSDGGHTLYNPFVENYIMDAFTTEIGGEIYVRASGITLMAGAGNGMIKGNVDSLIATPQDNNIHKSPSFYGKLAFDKQLAEKLRFRLALSGYTNKSSGSNNLYGGDRTGSNYFMVLEPAKNAAGANTTYSGNAFSGRFDPKFSKQVSAAQVNAFVKAYGLEVFGTYERATGRTKTETAKRDASQYAIEGVYRFGNSENLFVGARYNTVDAEILAGTSALDVSVERTAFSAGWFLTKNILLKGEYVTQKYKDFAPTDVRAGGKFDGYVIQAVVGF